MIILQIPTFKTWYEGFKLLHKIFIENPSNSSYETNDPDYVSKASLN